MAWNIRSGGGTRVGRVVEALRRFDADFLVASEFRIGETGAAIQAALAAMGYHLSHPPAQAGVNTVLLASRQPFGAAGTLDPALPEARHLWCAETGGVRLAGVYMPGGKEKVPYWEAVIRAASAGASPDLFVGDFNTGRNNIDKEPRGEAFTRADFMDQIDAAGYVDLWRSRHPAAREYTWFSPRGRNGFRLDHAFGSARFAAAVKDCRYDHGLRLDGVSDHSALLIDFGPMPPDTSAP